MRRFRSRQFVVLAVVALGTWNCTSITTPTVTPPNAPGTSITEIHSAQLTPNGSVTFSFSTNASGAISASLTSIAPDTGLTLGLALGILSGTSCEIVIKNDLSTQGTAVLGVAGSASNFCAVVYDSSGVVTTLETVSVTLTHF
jgi:hypothetical protein